MPFHRNALERELPVLIGNALNRRLSQICDQARADRAGFARSIRSGGVMRGSGLAGQLAATFVDALESTPESRASSLRSCELRSTITSYCDLIALRRNA